jgi:hypothetical protein
VKNSEVRSTTPDGETILRPFDKAQGRPFDEAQGGLLRSLGMTHHDEPEKSGWPSLVKDADLWYNCGRQVLQRHFEIRKARNRAFPVKRSVVASEKVARQPQITVEHQ